VSEIDERDLSQRLPESLSHDEVSSLTKSFNQALERLEEAFNRQKRFSASAAHELKTPLATMKAGIQVLKIDKSTTLDEYKENAQVIEASVDRLTQVVNDLLILASPNEEADELTDEVNLDAMLETIFDELSPIYEYRGITYNIECDTISFYGNAALLYRAFFNLIENSYKYNRENGSITVRGSKTNHCVRIDVEDTGIGIPSEHLPFIFDAFYRVDGSRSRKIAGSGLGLSIVKTIVERHGGTIIVSSEYAKGTRVSIQFPQ
jgi:signal transduction histidine kinase